MRADGKVRRWDEARGFGFIESSDGRDVFFHVRDFQGSATPVTGLKVSYEKIHVGGKGPRAMDVRPCAESGASNAWTPPARLGPKASVSTSAPRDKRKYPRQTASQARRPPAGNSLAMALMLAWLGLLVWGGWSARLPPILLAAMAVLNLATYMAYAKDKSAARRGAWRVHEGTLHLLALLGGWPAAWWAQQWLRHKSSKTEFRHVYWTTLILNCAALVWLVGNPDQLAVLRQAIHF